MKAFGFLSFGHYADVPGSATRTAGDMLKQTIEIAEGADEIGVNGAYVRVHHWARQAASPIPLLAAMAARTKRIEVGTGVVDMRYENPFQFAEEAAALDYIADGRLALGVSRGSPETALRGYETFGYVDAEDTERGSVMAREKFDLFLRLIDGERIAPGDPRMVGAGQYLAIEPQSPTLRDHIWWGSGSRATAETTGRLRVDFRRRSILAGTATAILAAVVLALAWVEAPWFFAQMFSLRSLPVVVMGLIFFGLSAWAVFGRFYRIARIAAAAEVVVLLLGWGLAHQPYLVYPDLKFTDIAAPATTLRFLFWSLPFGAAVLVPSLWLLFKVFKGERR